MDYLQKTYTCVLKFKGEQLHSVPLEEVTLDELRLLAYIHGGGSIDSIRTTGMKRIVSHTTEGGDPVYVENQGDEYKRLARKYDQLVNSGRGKKMVEACFNTHLIDFENVIEEVDAVGQVEALAAVAEAKAQVAQAAALRPEDGDPAQKPTSPLDRAFN